MDRELLNELKSFLAERMVDNMSTEQLAEYVQDDLFTYFDKQGEHDFPALGVGGADAHIAGAHHRQRRLHLAALVEHLVGAEWAHPGQRRHLAQRRLGQPGQQRAAFQYFENVIDHRPDTP